MTTKPDPDALADELERLSLALTRAAEYQAVEQEGRGAEGKLAQVWSNQRPFIELTPSHDPKYANLAAALIAKLLNSLPTILAALRRVGEGEIEAMSLDEGQRAFLDDMFARGPTRAELYRLFDAGCQVRAVADKMYWAVRNEEADAFKAAMAEYEQVVGLNFSAPDVAAKPFAALTPSAPVSPAREEVERELLGDVMEFLNTEILTADHFNTLGRKVQARLESLSALQPQQQDQHD